MKVGRLRINNDPNATFYVMEEKYGACDKVDYETSSRTKGSLGSEQYNRIILKAELEKRQKLARIRTQNKRYFKIFPVPKWLAHDTEKRKPQPVHRHNLHHVIKYEGARLSKIYNLSKSECSVLVHIFWKISNATMKITPEQFRTFFTTTFNCCHRIPVFLRGYDRYHSLDVVVDEFVRLFAVMMRGTPEQKAKFVFEIYDFNAWGYINREVLQAFLGDSFSSPQAAGIFVSDEEQRPVQDTIDFLMKKMDKYKEGKIYCKTFVDYVLKNPILRECCCEIFPKEEYVRLFKAMLFR